VTSFQDIPDRQRVEAISISRQTGTGPHSYAGYNKTVRQSAADDARSNFMRRFYMPPSADASGRATRLVNTPHRTDGDRNGRFPLDRRHVPATQPRCARRSSPH
jgi:hypothetical protein